MTPKTLRQLGILATLLVVLLVILSYDRTPVPGGRASARPPARGAAGGVAVIDEVRLETLTLARPEPAVGTRNPFRFRATAPPPPPGSFRPSGSAAAAPVGPPVPAGPPPPPPITLKFIGVVEQSARLKLAVLSDGRNVFYGKEGDTIEGRYRIERIAAESVEMAYLDGRGRQTLRLSGS